MDNQTSIKIPTMYVDRIESVEHDEDGYWLGLKDGWCCDLSTHVIHEDTQARVLECLRDISLCYCRQCVKELAT